jgi:hypothetical protein
VKIEAQGYDHEVVEGLERTFAANPQLIVLAELSTRELQRRGVDPASVLARYEALGYKLSVFHEARHLRQVRPNEVLAVCCAMQPAVNLTVILSRAQKPRFSGGRARPVRVEGLDVKETSGGLTIFHPMRNRVHELNPSAAIIFDLCTGEIPLVGIVELVQELYGLPHPPAVEVARCLDYLYGEGLVI